MDSLVSDAAMINFPLPSTVTSAMDEGIIDDEEIFWEYETLVEVQYRVTIQVDP